METDGQPIRNVATGQSHSLLYKSKLECINQWNELYNDFKEERLDKKTTSIFDPLKRTKTVVAEESTADFILKLNIKKEMARMQKYLH